ncbi:MAG: hypothetical protein QOI21_4158 [Actinomycetota bacterium]|jgi:dipeptidyl aminopeptidase/acylaminoacyl peptidase|nr:hypothetical protein [Actinomycetota bacterium]
MTENHLIPQRVLFGEPAVTAPSLSPSGTHLAYLAPHEDDVAVWVGSLADRDFRPLRDLRARYVEDYLWARDGRHLLYLADHDGDECEHLMAVDLRTGKVRDLTPFPGVHTRVVGLQTRVPDQVLVEMNLEDSGRNDLYRIDLAGARREPVAAEPGLSGWLTDPDLRVRAARRQLPGGGLEVLARDDEYSAWRVLLELDYEDATATSVLGFTGDGKDLLLLSPLGADTVRLLRLSTVTGAVDVLYEDPAYDVTSATVHPVTGQVDLVTVERDRTELIGLTADTRARLARIRESTRGDVTSLGRDLDDRWWLVQDNFDRGPAAFWLFDRVRGTGEVLFTHQPELDGYRLSAVEPFDFTARDGLQVHGYLTFPPGDRAGLPAVLNVHGGPWERNRWGFRAESQWLANRGYLTIEVNYRGSTGYGRRFELAGDREWGGRMQDDLIDAVRHVVGRGFADPGRIAVYGTSYGGYAALVGAAFTPEVFRCAVAVAAPANLRTFVESVPDYWRPIGDRLARRIGDPRTDADFLWSRSPLSRVADIRIPILLAYGGNDPRVPVSEAEQLVKALRANDVRYEYLYFPGEGHGFRKPANVFAFRAAAEKFLAENLGGRWERP